MPSSLLRNCFKNFFFWKTIKFAIKKYFYKILVRRIVFELQALKFFCNFFFQFSALLKYYSRWTFFENIFFGKIRQFHPNLTHQFFKLIHWLQSYLQLNFGYDFFGLFDTLKNSRFRNIQLFDRFYPKNLRTDLER